LEIKDGNLISPGAYDYQNIDHYSFKNRKKIKAILDKMLIKGKIK